MRVVTLNTWGIRGDWEGRLSVLQEGFRELDADLVVLQETILTVETDQAAAIVGPGYHLAQQRDREQDGQGITTASKWPFGRVWVANHFPTTSSTTNVSVCDRSAWESARPGQPQATYLAA
jgi:hypothetical protein